MIKRLLSIILFLASLQLGWSFALLGPIGNGGDSWQTGVIGYGLAYTESASPGGPVFLGDIGAPKNIGEGYRRNTPQVYYAYNANFLGFFGSDGATNVDGAFAIMNSLTNVSSYSSDLSEFPDNSQQFDFQAQSLFLTDVKSVTLHLLVETMGLASPERYTWTLAERFLPPGGKCPFDEIYLVLQRNFADSPTAPSQTQYSAYVNDVLYSYFIIEACSGPNPLAITVPYSADPLATEYTSVAANDFDGFGGAGFGSGGGLQIGGYFTGLTRDDVAGLRYLYQSNNIVTENTAAGSLLLTTNFGTAVLLTNIDLALFNQQALTNSPAALLALYPQLEIISGPMMSFSNVITPNVVTFITNGGVGSTFGTTRQVTVTNGFSPNFFPIYTNYVFGNLLTNYVARSNKIVVQTISVTNLIGSPFGSTGSTNTKTSNVTLTNTQSGDIFIIPTNWCGFNVLDKTYKQKIPSFTNTLVSASGTNSFGTAQFTQIQIYFFTNRIWVVQPLICQTTTNGPALRPGIEKVQFIRANFDSLISQFFSPITNTYSTVLVNPTNGQALTETLQRIVTAPDILLSADDDIAANTFNGTVTRNVPNFDTANVLTGLAGPGVINSPVVWDYNKIGNAFENGSLAEEGFTTNQFLSEMTQTPVLAWASFDGSTNPPEVYPNGNSIQNLQNQILTQVTPTSLPNGTHNVAYPTQTFTLSGGSLNSQLTWTASGLPSGLVLSTNGIFSGTPTQVGTFELTIKATDSISRTVEWFYTLIIQ